MSTEYAGNPVYAVSITIPTDDDEFDAASVAVPLEQLADRTAYLKQLIEDGIGFELTDAVLHGDTTFPDGTITATVDNASLTTTGTFSIASIGDLLFVGGNAFEVGSTTTVLITAGTDMTINVGDDLNVDVNGDANIDIAGNLIITGVDTLDYGGGLVIIAPSSIELATNVTLGGGTGDTVEARGTLQATHNATFAAGKTVTLSGDTTVPSGGTLAVVSGGSLSVHAGAGALISAEVGLDGSIDLIGTGYISERQGVQATDANTTIAALAYTTYKIPNGVLSATRLLTINNGPSGKHPRIRIWSNDAAFGMDLRNQGGGIIGGTVIDKGTLGAGEYRWVDIEWNGSSSWEIVGGERS